MGKSDQDIFAGPCVGGPFDGKNLYHGTPVFKVALHGMKVVSMVSKTEPYIQFGRYIFDDCKWNWCPP